MLDRINVSYSQKGCKRNPQSYIKICNYSFSSSGVLLSRKAPLIHFYSYSVFFFFPEIPAITIINQKNGCLQFINVKLSASNASTAARCARSHQITFLPSPVHQKSSRNQSIRKPDIKKAGMNLVDMKHIKNTRTQKCLKSIIWNKPLKKSLSGSV